MLGFSELLMAFLFLMLSRASSKTAQSLPVLRRYLDFSWVVPGLWVASLPEFPIGVLAVFGTYSLMKWVLMLSWLLLHSAKLQL